MDRIQIKKGSSLATDPKAAVAELAEQIEQDGACAVILFASPRYDLAHLGAAIRERFDCPVIGCTTAGEIVSGIGYIDGGLVGVSLASPELIVHMKLITGLEGFDVQRSAALAEQLRGELRLSDRFDPAKMFGLLLIDGMSMLEEQVTASLYGSLDGVSLIGGSAGDELNFGSTHVYFDGAFHSDAALFSLFETSLPFRIFRVQHFEPTETRLVITEADGLSRTVSEINGEPAAEEYARAVGLEVKELSPQVFAAYPVMLKINGEYYVRSIQKVNPDGSLTFFCAIDNGLVLTVAHGSDLVEHLRQNLAALHAQMPNLKLLLGCDCILRRLELVQKGTLADAGAAIEGAQFVGFSTYGEQFNGIHVNQTLTGLAIGG